MDLKKCEVLLTAIDLGSLTKAGEVFGYTQSGVTQMMKSLEREVGVPIINKGHKGVSLTPEGEALLPSIRSLLFANENVNQEIASLRGLKKGTLRIGSLVSCSIKWLPEVIEKFQETYPDIVFQIMEGGGMEIINWLHAYNVDIGLTSQQEDMRCEFIPVMEDPYMAVLPVGHPLAEYEYVSVHQFNNVPFLMADSSDDTDMRRLLKKYDVHPDIKYTGKNDFSVAAMVEHKLGVSIEPELFLDCYKGDYIIRPLEPNITRTLGVALRSHKEISPAMKLFFQYLKKEYPPRDQ